MSVGDGMLLDDWDGVVASHDCFHGGLPSIIDFRLALVNLHVWHSSEVVFGRFAKTVALVLSFGGPGNAILERLLDRVLFKQFCEVGVQRQHSRPLVSHPIKLLLDTRLGFNAQVRPTKHPTLVLGSQIQNRQVWAYDCSLAWTWIECLALENRVSKSLSARLMRSKLHRRLKTHCSSTESSTLASLRSCSAVIDTQIDWVWQIMLLISLCRTLRLSLVWYNDWGGWCVLFFLIDDCR